MASNIYDQADAAELGPNATESLAPRERRGAIVLQIELSYATLEGLEDLASEASKDTTQLARYVVERYVDSQPSCT